MIKIILITFSLFLMIGCGGSGEDGGTNNNGDNTINSVPVANAGSDQNVITVSLVTLDGGACSDDDGDTLTYHWSIISIPAGSSAVLSNSNSVNPTFTVDVDGTYLISLIVNDGKANSAANSVTITANTPRLSVVSNLPDTGQMNCFDNSKQIPCPSSGISIYGQDAQYSTNPMSFEDNNDGTITDNVTGLMWQKDDDGNTYNWYEATGTYDITENPTSIDVCGSLTLSGYFDWRIPTRRELMSIVNYGMYVPSIDTLYFPNIKSDYYWTSSSYAHPTGGGAAWRLSFYGGYIYTFGKTGDNYVRCVRASYWGTNSFTDNGNGTITDNKSGLMWQKQDDGVDRFWEQALSYCESLTLAGYTDWRLPDIKELESIVDVTRYGPSINTTYFPNTKFSTSGYWSSSSNINSPSYAWYVIFNGGEVVLDLKNDKPPSVTFYARCVR